MATRWSIKFEDMIDYSLWHNTRMWHTAGRTDRRTDRRTDGPRTTA